MQNRYRQTHIKKNRQKEFYYKMVIAWKETALFGRTLENQRITIFQNELFGKYFYNSCSRLKELMFKSFQDIKVPFY